jgi:hypothetical protein
MNCLLLVGIHDTLLSMTSEHILSLLIEERDRVHAAIAALKAGGVEGGGKVRRKPGRKPKAVSAPTAHIIDPLPGLTPKPRKKAKWSAAKRKALGEKLRMHWAAKRAGKSKGGKVPF